MKSLLLVEDDQTLSTLLFDHLSGRFNVLRVATLREASNLVACRKFDLALLDMNLPDGNGLTLVSRLAHDYQIPVIVATAYAKIEFAVQAVKEGAADFISKPFDFSALDLVIDRTFANLGLSREVQILRRQVPHRPSLQEVLGYSKKTEQLKVALSRMAQVRGKPVLIIGEIGTGKSFLSEVFHQESPWRDMPLIVAKGCALQISQLEKDFFGLEEEGGGRLLQMGLIEMAQGGTLVLDEISEWPQEFQGRLVDLLESGTYRRVQGTTSLRADVQIVATASCELFQSVELGRFRRDLYYRLNVATLSVSPLRERREDIGPLTDYYLDEIARRHNRSAFSLGARAREGLTNYRWPGNVRELLNVLERSVILTAGPRIEWIPLELPTVNPLSLGCSFNEEIQSLEMAPTLEEVERQYVRKIYEMAKGNKSRAAEVLGLSRLTLRQKLLADDPTAQLPAKGPDNPGLN